MVRLSKEKIGTLLRAKHRERRRPCTTRRPFWTSSARVCRRGSPRVAVGRLCPSGRSCGRLGTRRRHGSGSPNSPSSGARAESPLAPARWPRGSSRRSTERARGNARLQSLGDGEEDLSAAARGCGPPFSVPIARWVPCGCFRCPRRRSPGRGDGAAGGGERGHLHMGNVVVVQVKIQTQPPALSTHRDRRDGRDLVPLVPVSENGSLAARGPPPSDAGDRGEACFVHEHQVRAQPLGFF